jgi:hypothetical protein
MTGSGTIGDILPNWSVSEFATPVVIGETNNGLGSISFTAEALEDSILISNNNITVEHTDSAGNLGSFIGTIKSVSQNGATVNANGLNVLSKFDADYNIPYLNAGSLWSAVDLLTQVTGTVRISAEPLMKDV